MTSSMCVLIYNQITLLCEPIIIHITVKWMISYMFELVCLQITLLCQQLITVDYLLYVCTDIQSDYPAV